MTQSELLDRLESDLNELLKQLRNQFVGMPPETLGASAMHGQWSAQACFAHLNAQFDYYLPRIELALHKAKSRRWNTVPERRSNGLGRSAIRSADPAFMDQKPRKSPKKIDPNKLLPVRENEIKVFLINIEMLLRLIRQAREVDLNKARVKPMNWTLFSDFLLGDLLEYIVRHAQRHTIQAGRAIGIS